jgi:hypothetical protein
MGHKFLLCRPTGGLTDILSQVGRTIEYAKAHQRRLIIDTNIPDFFNEPLSKYLFSSRQLRATTNPSKLLISRLNRLTCKPTGIQGRLDTYKAQQISPADRRLVAHRVGHFTNLEDARTREPLTFDFRVDHSEDLLVHHCSGNDLQNALTSLDHLWPVPELRRSVRRRLRVLPATYDALHIRHTDLESDLDLAADSVNHCSDIPLLVSTDSHTAASEVVKKIRSRPIVFASKPVDPTSFGLATNATTHKNASALPRHAINTAAFVDLICLARARTLMSGPLLPGQCKMISGYFELAKQLQKSQHLISRYIA